VSELLLASAANVWLTDWLSEVARAPDAAAELLFSVEKLSEATIENKKIRKAIIIVACFKILFLLMFNSSLSYIYFVLNIGMN
jgi:hypothetical protein